MSHPNISRRATIIAFLTILWPVALPARARQWQTLRIASEGARPPYNFLDANGELAGLEIDLARELCARAKLACTFVVQDWDNLIPRLLGDHYDAIMSAMEITDRRRETIDFSAPYIRMPSSFAVARHSAIHSQSPEAMAGQKIGVARDSPHHAYLAAHYKASQIRTYANLEEAILDLPVGRVDAAFGIKDELMMFLATRREAEGCVYLGDATPDIKIFGQGIGAGLRKGDSELKALFDTALGEVVADGTFARIRATYFSFEVN